MLMPEGAPSHKYPKLSTAMVVTYGTAGRSEMIWADSGRGWADAAMPGRRRMKKTRMGGSFFMLCIISLQIYQKLRLLITVWTIRHRFWILGYA